MSNTALTDELRAALEILGPLSLRALRAAWRGSPDAFWASFDLWQRIITDPQHPVGRALEVGDHLLWLHSEGTWLVARFDARCDLYYFHLEREDVERRRFRTEAELLQAVRRRATALALQLGEPRPFSAPRAEPLSLDAAREQLREARRAVEKKRPLRAGKGLSAHPSLSLREGSMTKAELIHLLRRDYDKEELRVGPALAALGEPESLDALGAFLAPQGLAKPAARWAARAAAALGGPLTARAVAEYIRENARSAKGHTRCIAALEIAERLALRGEPRASLAIYALAATRTGYRPRRLEAQRALADVAAAFGETPARHLLRCFADSARDLDEEVRLRWLAGLFFEDLMLRGERFDEDFLDEILDDSPLLAGLAQLLAWGVYDREGRVVAVGQLLGGELVDALSGQRVEVDLDERLGVLHPAEVDDETVAAWRAHMTERQLAPPFEQLERRVFFPTDKQARSTRLFEYVGVQREDVEDQMIDFGFFRDSSADLYTAALPRDDHVVVALVDLSGQVAELRSGGAGTGCAELPIGQLNPVSVSELMRAFEPQGPRVVLSGVRRQRGRFPFAERAKTGRARCIGCGEKIAKGEVRIGVERESDEIDYRGVVTMWCHPRCAARIEELRLVPDLDAVLTRNSDGLWPPGPEVANDDDG